MNTFLLGQLKTFCGGALSGRVGLVHNKVANSVHHNSSDLMWSMLTVSQCFSHSIYFFLCRFLPANNFTDVAFLQGRSAFGGLQRWQRFGGQYLTIYQKVACGERRTVVVEMLWYTDSQLALSTVIFFTRTSCLFWSLCCVWSYLGCLV